MCSTISLLFTLVRCMGRCRGWVGIGFEVGVGLWLGLVVEVEIRVVVV